MNKTVITVACIAVCSFIAACSSDDVVVQEPAAYSSIVMSNSEGISFEYNDVVSLSDIGDKASIHCASEGKKAVLINNITPPNGGMRVAAFDCR